MKLSIRASKEEEAQRKQDAMVLKRFDKSAVKLYRDLESIVREIAAIMKAADPKRNESVVNNLWLAVSYLYDGIIAASRTRAKLQGMHQLSGVNPYPAEKLRLGDKIIIKDPTEPQRITKIFIEGDKVFIETDKLEKNHHYVWPLNKEIKVTNRLPNR